MYNIKITHENIELFEDVLKAFKSDLEELSKLIRKNPVELEFGGYRFVFDKRSEVEDLIKHLEEGINNFRGSQNGQNYQI